MKTDAQIHEAVLAEFRRDPHVQAADVGVQVEGGVVTLTGTVYSHAKKFAATEAAHRVAGVLDVADDIQVRPPGVAGTDTEIAHAVRHALDEIPSQPGGSIRTTVAHGWVTLQGTVERPAQSLAAESAVCRLPGVLHVINRLSVAPRGATAPDEPIRVANEAADRRAERGTAQIEIAVEDDTVTVAGTVPTWLRKRAVMSVAGHLPGVQRVIDRLHVS